MKTDAGLRNWDLWLIKKRTGFLILSTWKDWELFSSLYLKGGELEVRGDLFHISVVPNHGSTQNWPLDIPYWHSLPAGRPRSKIWLLLDGQIVHQTQVNHQSFKNIFPKKYPKVWLHVFITNSTLLFSCSVMSDYFATPWTASHQAPLCPWDYPGKNTGMDCHFLLQGILPTQGSNPHLLCLMHCRQILYCWVTGKPKEHRGNKQDRCTVIKLQWPS